MLQRLRLRNYRAFTDSTSPEFARMNVIFGENGAGKSSYKDAIALLFSGTSTGRENGRGLDGLRTIGGEPGKKWQINAQLFVKGKLETIGRTDAEGPGSDKQKLIEALTGTPGAKARACLEAGELKRMKPEERQRFLMNLVPKNATAVPAEIRASIKKLLGEDHAEVDLSTLERLYKAAYEARTEANRAVTAVGEIVEPTVPEAIAEFDPLPDANEIRVALDELRNERETLLIKAAPQTTDLKPYRDAVTSAEEALAEVRLDIGKLPTKMEIGHKATELAAKLHDVGETNRGIEARRAELREKLGIADGTMKQAKRALEALNDADAASCCPTCSKKLNKAERTNTVMGLQNKYDSAGRDWQTVKLQLDAEPEPASTVKIELEVGELAAKERRLIGLLEKETKLQEQLADKRKSLELAETLPTMEGDEAAAEEAQALGLRILKGEGVLEAVVKYAEQRQAYTTAVDRKASTTDKHVALDRLVKDLGPDGLRKSVGGDGLLKLHDDLNAELEPRGFAVDLRPALDLTGDPLITIKGKPIPLSEVSDGEMIAFGAALSCAVATYTGLGLVAVDKWEQLTPAANEAVTAMLESSGHQVFIFMGDREDGTEARAIEMNAANDGWRMFLLRDGQLLAPGIAAETGAAA